MNGQTCFARLHSLQMVVAICRFKKELETKKPENEPMQTLKIKRN